MVTRNFLLFACAVLVMALMCINGASSAPAGWTCDPARYNASDGCDCVCGVPDPDCDVKPTNYTVPRGCPCYGQICVSGYCSGTCGETTETLYAVSQLKAYRVVVIIMVFVLFFTIALLLVVICIRYHDEEVIALARELQAPVVLERQKNANNEALQKMYPSNSQNIFQKLSARIKAAKQKKSADHHDDHEMTNLTSANHV